MPALYSWEVARTGRGGGGPSPPTVAPLILYTDITAGPTSGGESNKGCYLSIFGLNLGSFADYGTTNLVTIGGVAVDNYRCLVDPVGGASNKVASLLGIKRLVVQVGALGSPAAGTALAISVTVGGVSPSNTQASGKYLDLNGEAITFTPQPGTMYFVDPVSGSDSNPGTFASPYATLQGTTGSTGAMKKNTSANATDGVHPGSHFVLMGNAHSSTGQANRWVDLSRITGTAPTGGTDRGPVVITAYPGAAGANAPNYPTWTAAAGKGGGVNGNDSTRAQETSTSFGGFTGWCQYIHVCNLHIISSPTADSDGGCVNMQSTARNWRVVNNDLEWRSTVTGVNHGKSGGIEGSALNSRVYGNYIHDIYGDTSFNENHGIYLDGNITVATDVISAFNHIQDITAGNGIQTYDGVNGAGMTNLVIHTNWIETVNKNSLNIVDNTKSCQAYNNVLIGAGEHAIRLSTDAATAANAFYFGHNTCYNWDRVYSAATRFAFADEGTLGTGAASGVFENNGLMQPSTHPTLNYGFYYTNSGRVTARTNRWYDAAGRLSTKPSEDSTGSYGDLGFTNAAAGDFTLQSGSACLGAATTPAVITRTKDFLCNPAPYGASHDIGAIERQSA